MSKLIKPTSFVLDSGAARSLQMNALFVANSPTVWRNMVGRGVADSVSPANQRYGAGPGGLGGQFTSGNVYETFWTRTAADQPKNYGNRATFFGVASLRSLGTNQTFLTVGGAGGWIVTVGVDSTNGFRTSYVDGGYSEVDIHTIGTPPALDAPIAFVVRASGSSHANVRSIHTSDGRFTSTTAGRTTYDELGTAGLRTYMGGNDEHGRFNGHIYQFGYSEKLWTDLEISDYLEDPWYFLRRRSVAVKFAPALPTSSAPEVAVTGNSVDIVNGDATPSAGDHTDFGSTVQGTGTITRTFTVHNTGTALLNVSGLSVPTGFTIVDGLPLSILAGGSDDMVIRLDDAVVGTKSGNVSFTTNDSNENPFTFAITGVVNSPPPPPPPPPPPSPGDLYRAIDGLALNRGLVKTGNDWTF